MMQYGCPYMYIDIHTHRHTDTSTHISSILFLSIVQHTHHAHLTQHTHDTLRCPVPLFLFSPTLFPQTSLLPPDSWWWCRVVALPCMYRLSRVMVVLWRCCSRTRQTSKLQTRYVWEAVWCREWLWEWRMMIGLCRWWSCDCVICSGCVVGCVHELSYGWIAMHAWFEAAYFQF